MMGNHQTFQKKKPFRETVQHKYVTTDNIIAAIFHVKKRSLNLHQAIKF